eukprot:CAMPEP_0178408678 /NCGR_PEP_ID=MMETSP0689_2-20121128/20066_1 /TAXON_ID=160604 /ORGANISM="Amphidinium massartii, Strain CS-259" /LENGTH=240 /DNA_ID=CAMNT_0020029787 /DNA_START=89 /DNA_END=811 /DNA_ORIENTATION=+
MLGQLSVFAIALALVVLVLGLKVFSSMPGLFWGHIVSMLTCWFLAVSASVTYVLSSSLQPQWSLESRKKARVLHGMLMSLALVAAIVGYYCIFENHAEMGASQFGLDPGNPPARVVHAMAGHFLVLCMILQAYQGLAKFIKLQGVQSELLAKLGSIVPAHALRGKVLVPLMGLNAAIVVTVMPGMTTLQFATMEGGLLGASLLAAWLAGQRPASARETQSRVADSSDGYVPLSAADTAEQ